MKDYTNFGRREGQNNASFLLNKWIVVIYPTLQNLKPNKD